MRNPENWSDNEVISDFFKMVRTVIMWVFWLFFTLYWAVFQDLAFFDKPHVPMWEHILFFAWVVITLPLLIWITLKKIWHII